MQSINRRQVAVRKSLTEETDDGGYMPGAAEERLLEVWELTLEAWPCSGKQMLNEHYKEMLQCLSDSGWIFAAVAQHQRMLPVR